MKNNEATVFIFIAAIIIGFLIASNMSFEKENKIVFLNAEQYQEAYKEKNTITKDMLLLNGKFLAMKDKLDKYEKSSKNVDKLYSEVKEELYNYKTLNGSNEVYGKGFTITLEDYNNLENDKDSTSLDIVHDKDIYNIVNDLRAAGAEGISINGERIVNTSEIYCFGPEILINGKRSPSPYVFNVIGDSEKIKTYILLQENTLGKIYFERPLIKIIISDEIEKTILPAYNFNNDKSFLVPIK